MGSTYKSIGKVRWFNKIKGYGFINEEGNASDVFVHYGSILMDGYKNLEEGQKVQFDLYSDSAKGLQARNVEVIS